MIKSSALVVAVFAALSCPSAEAQNARTWVSGAGVDQAGCGAIANPCRTLQYAHNVTNAGGRIDVKDSAGYGAIVIGKAISVIGTGSLAGVLAAPGGNAIAVTAGATDAVVLRGLTIEGGGGAGAGIVLNSAARLDVAESFVQNFATGVLLQPSAGTPKITIVDTTVNGSGKGIFYTPPRGSSAAANITLDRVKVIGNQEGIYIEGIRTSGATRAAITNSLAANNASDGFNLNGANVAIDLSIAENNSGNGFYVEAGTLEIGRSVSVNNEKYGLRNFGGTVSSYKDNRFSRNLQGQTIGTIGTATPF